MGTLVYILVFLSLFSSAAVSISVAKSTMDAIITAVSPTPLGWSSATHYCDWRGVECDGKNRVLSLTIPSQSLYGSLPPFLNTLTQLINISLENNHFSGPLPSFANLSRLRKLHLDNNSFTSVPKGAFSGLIGLQILSLSNNPNLSPWPFPTELANSTEILMFHASNANMLGSIPDIFGDLSRLVNLTLFHNNLTGSLPGSFNGSTIRDLRLDNQKSGLTGNIYILSGMTNLSVVWLNGNHFTGVVPPSLRNLIDIRLEKNDFSDDSNTSVGSFNCPRCKFFIRTGVNNTATANSSSRKKKKINVAAKVGIIVGVVVVSIVLVICLVILFILFMAKLEDRAEERQRRRRLTDLLQEEVRPMPRVINRGQGQNVKGRQNGSGGKKKKVKPGKKDVVEEAERGQDEASRLEENEQSLNKEIILSPFSLLPPRDVDVIEGIEIKDGERVESQGNQPRVDNGGVRHSDENKQRLSPDEEEVLGHQKGKQTVKHDDIEEGDEERGRLKDVEEDDDDTGVRVRSGIETKDGDRVESQRKGKGKLYQRPIDDKGDGARGRLKDVEEDDDDKGVRVRSGIETKDNDRVESQSKGKGKRYQRPDKGDEAGKRKKEMKDKQQDDNGVVRDENQRLSPEEEEDLRLKKGKRIAKDDDDHITKYTHLQLKSVTKNFHQDNIIGEGSFGIVYKGTLLDGTTMVAVKWLKSQERIDDFNNEVKALGQADHFNLVKLLGYCDDEKKGKFLVYEYMSNGSLEKWIFGTNPMGTLSWPEMKDIIQGISQGLEYLHSSYPNKILHRDLKPPNIVLDGNKKAKLCDFGVAKLLKSDQTSTWTQIAGTPRYWAPEVLRSATISEKVDVYSFGIVVLEILFGESYNHLLVKCGQHATLEVHHLPDLIKKLSPDMRKKRNEIKKIGELAVRCLHYEPKERPSMAEILVEIQTLYEQFDKPKPKRERRTATS